MKKIFTLMTLLMFGLASFTQTFSQDTAHRTKSGKLDKRYNANKHLKKDGTMDMRYKSSKHAAAKAKPKKS